MHTECTLAPITAKVESWRDAAQQAAGPKSVLTFCGSEQCSIGSDVAGPRCWLDTGADKRAE